MGIVDKALDLMQDAVDTVKEKVDDIRRFFGSSDHSEGPRIEYTYKKRDEWDAKKRNYEDQQQRLESERDEYSADAYRLDAVTEKRNRLARQITEEEARLEELQRRQTILSAEMESAVSAKKGEEARRAWKKTAEQMVDRVVDERPNLEKLVERMSDEYNERLEQRFEDSQKGLKSHRDSLVAAKRANTKETTQLKEQVALLQEIIQSLDELKRERQ